MVTADLRVSYPPDATPSAVAQAVLEAASRALAELGNDGGWLILPPLTVAR